MRKLLIFMLLISSIAALAQKPDTTYKLLEASYITLNAIDLGTTIYGLNHGAIEGNPIMGDASLGTITAVKGITVAGTVILGRLAYKNNPKAAKITMIGLNILSGLVVTNNVNIVINLNR